MVQYVRFLHEIYKDIKDKSKLKEIIRAIILSEARRNNDLVTIILRTDPMKIAHEKPALFEQLDTRSFDLITSLRISASEIFDDKKDPSEDNLQALDKTKNSLKYFQSRPQSELYEFYVRKISLLAALSRAGAVSMAKVGLKARLINIEHATRVLAQRLRLK